MRRMSSFADFAQESMLGDFGPQPPHVGTNFPGVLKGVGITGRWRCSAGTWICWGWGEGVAVSSDCREPVAIRRVRGTQRISASVAGGAERTLRREASARRRSWET